MAQRIIKLFLRASIAVTFLSAVADRFGWWPPAMSAWGNWESFLAYTATLLPWVPAAAVPALGWIATVAEVLLALGLLLGYKTEHMARWSGWLMLVFALSMAFFTGVKRPLDASVFTASAAAFALGLMKEKYLELDLWLAKR
ncbi:MAG TPA: DoxX family protein [Flavobacteriales bacterium]|nr:DoxX family protein [Flavobacteriales bacterium]